MKMLPTDEREDAEALIAAAGLDPKEFTFVLSETVPTNPGVIASSVRVGRGKTQVKFNRATWLGDLEQALKAHAFGG